MPTTKIALLGTGFIADIHARVVPRASCPTPRSCAVYSRSDERAEAFAGKHGIARWFDRPRSRRSHGTDCDVVDVCLPNDLHARATIAAAASAGKHVIIEKPLCLTLEEADEMIAVCKAHNRKLMYAEELCFAPKYERVRQLVVEGAIGSIYLHAAVREALRPAQRLVLRPGSIRRRRAHGHGLPRPRVVPLDARRPAAKPLSVHAQHADRAHPPRADALRRALDLHRRVRGRRDRRRREQLGEARRDGGPRRGLRHRRRDLRRSVHGQLGVDLQREGLRLRDGEGRLDPGLDASPCSRKRSIRDTRRS